MAFSNVQFEPNLCSDPNIQIAYPITETEWKLEKNVLREFECPVCVNYANPPIMMCLNSHIICIDCWKKCQVCPTCRAPKTFTRAFVMEKLHSLINFPCKWEGCSYLGTGIKTNMHEMLCNFFPVRCPLGDCHSCSWAGNMGTIMGHLTSSHNRNFIHANHVVLKSKLFAISRKKDYTVIFKYKGSLFKFYWNFNLAIDSKVRFGMIAIGNGNPIVMFSYSLMFAKRFPISNDCRKLRIMKTQVKKNPADCSVIDRSLPGNSRRPIFYNFEINYDDLLAFCERSLDLKYQVSIEYSHLTNVWS
ncbi:hypothetical protein ABEB36_013075 [Hypothenemus hampei]|uniref:RING-type E3 ubiquitin transferase n=1 Tax=Hypothenemus hampei TaxID=57062 RepID=A0ABD1E7L7_HYPHA